jgi:hypothetical protein
LARPTPSCLAIVGSAKARLAQRPDLFGFDAGLVTLVDASDLGGVERGRLFLERGEDAQHRQADHLAAIRSSMHSGIID